MSNCCSTLVRIAPRATHHAIQDAAIGGCQLNTLAKIGTALGVRTKRLYDEGEAQEAGPAG